MESTKGSLKTRRLLLEDILRIFTWEAMYDLLVIIVKDGG